MRHVLFKIFAQRNLPPIWYEYEIFVLAILQNDQTLVEIYTVVLNFGYDTCQIKLGFVQVNTKSVQMMYNCYFICPGIML